MTDESWPLLDYCLAALRHAKRKQTGESGPVLSLVETPVETAEEAFEREIALAHEVCGDQIEADAAVAHVTVEQVREALASFPSAPEQTN